MANITGKRQAVGGRKYRISFMDAEFAEKLLTFQQQIYPNQLMNYVTFVTTPSARLKSPPISPTPASPV